MRCEFLELRIRASVDLEPSSHDPLNEIRVQVVPEERAKRRVGAWAERRGDERASARVDDDTKVVSVINSPIHPPFHSPLVLSPLAVSPTRPLTQSVLRPVVLAAGLGYYPSHSIRPIQVINNPNKLCSSF